ncbi:MAG: rod shape-determining protein RodA [Alphaproteobacteria bacterium]|nr:rod shape-determining protein RodA [Alphaproteobacteria bacterium]
MAESGLSSSADAGQRSIGRKIGLISWPMVFLLIVIAAVGTAMLYSAGNGNWDPWASRHLMRFAVALALLIALAVSDLRFWLGYAYAIYGVVLALLLIVEFAGSIGMGAQRWINLGFMQLQPSELMKIALVLALARYFHSVNYENVARPLYLIVPAAMVAAPALLVLIQPDLGTAMMLVFAGAMLFFVAGVRLWKFGIVAALALAVVPLAWGHLREYQKKRILTFLDPESDPLGAGYHILQSKIALGSGGVSGKGYLQGTQSHLNFLPEKQTDFVFTMLAEELGLFGGLTLLFIFILLIAGGIAISLRVQSHFGRMVAIGITATFFLYVFINTAMVMGLLPVVGVPLPLVSNGGTAMLSVMIGFGLLLSADVHRDLRINRHGDSP